MTKLSVDGLATALKKKVPGQSLGRRGHGPATWTTGTPGLMARAEPGPTPTKVRRNTTVSGGGAYPQLLRGREACRGGGGGGSSRGTRPPAERPLRDRFRAARRKSVAWLAIGTRSLRSSS